MTAVEYVYLWGVKFTGETFLHLFNLCYHMVGRPSDVSLSRFDYTIMKSAQDNNVIFNVALQAIDHSKTSTYQELFIYPDREFIIYGWYWPMAYTCVMDPTNVKYIVTRFYSTVFKSSEAKIDSKVSHMFRKTYKRFYAIFQKYRSS